VIWTVQELKERTCCKLQYKGASRAFHIYNYFV